MYSLTFGLIHISRRQTIAATTTTTVPDQRIDIASTANTLSAVAGWSGGGGDGGSMLLLGKYHVQTICRPHAWGLFPSHHTMLHTQLASPSSAYRLGHRVRGKVNWFNWIVFVHVWCRKMHTRALLFMWALLPYFHSIREWLEATWCRQSCIDWSIALLDIICAVMRCTLQIQIFQKMEYYIHMQFARDGSLWLKSLSKHDTTNAGLAIFVVIIFNMIYYVLLYENHSLSWIFIWSEGVFRVRNIIFLWIYVPFLLKPLKA